IRETAIIFDALFRTLKLADINEISTRDEIGRLDEITGGPCDPGCEYFRMDFIPEFDRPRHPICIRNFNFWVRAGHIFFDKSKRRLRRVLAPARSPNEIQLRHIAWIAPDDGCAGWNGVFLFLYCWTACRRSYSDKTKKQNEKRGR